MQTLRSYQFVELSQHELVNVSGGASGCLCNVEPGPNIEITLGGQNFDLTAMDYVIRTTDEGISICLTGFLGLGASLPLGPLWRMG